MISFAQTISSHYTPSRLHILKMMMNATTTLQPTVEYSTFLFLLFSIHILLLFFSTISLPLLTFVYVHSSVFPFPLLLFVMFQWHSSPHDVVNSKTSKMHITSNNKHKFLSMVTLFFHP